MKRLLLTMLLLGLVAEGFAQEESLFLSSQRQPVRLSFGASYQRYVEGDSMLAEVSVPLAISAPLGRRFAVSLLASGASATGDGVTSLSGLTDVQLGLSFIEQIGQSSLVASLGVNLPSGKRELEQDEFLTTISLSQHFFNFRVPGFGQGFNVEPGLVWAFPVGEDVVLGLGAAFQYKGPYKPLSSMAGDYDPGDEVLLTGGLDVRLGPTTNLSADFTFTHYMADRLGDVEFFSAGDRVTATGQVLSSLGQHQVRLVARYRGQAKSSIPADLASADAALRTIPSMGLLIGSYDHQLSGQLRLGLLARARLFGETDLFERKTLFDLGLAPEVVLSPAVRLRTRFVYTLGDFTGFEAGGGLAVEL